MGREAIALVPAGLDVARASAVIAELVAQAIDVDLEVALIAVGGTPDALQQSLVRDKVADVLCKQLQQHPLRPGQFDGFAPQAHRARSGRSPGRPRSCRSPGSSPQPPG